MSCPPTRPRSRPRWRQLEVTRVGVSIDYTVCELVTESKDESVNVHVVH